jgi:hypothetical protein
MVESDVAEYLASVTTLETDKNLFLSELPLEKREGVVVRVLRESKTWGALFSGVLIVMVFKESYPDARNLASTISTELNDRRGTLDASWTVTKKVEMTNYGKDELDRYTFVVTCPISYL